MFNCVKTNMGTTNVPETVYLPVKEGEEIMLGEALKIEGGELTKATANAQYIALKDAKSGEIPCMRVTGEDVYECEITEELSACVLGDKLALSANAMNVGAKSDSGAAKIERFVGGKAVGDRIWIRFI